MKDNFDKDGIELNDDEFGEITEIARSYQENGVLTERSYQKAMLDKYGPERFAKFYEIKGAEKTRKDMAETKEKVTKTKPRASEGRKTTGL